MHSQDYRTTRHGCKFVHDRNEIFVNYQAQLLGTVPKSAKTSYTADSRFIIEAHHGEESKARASPGVEEQKESRQRKSRPDQNFLKMEVGQLKSFVATSNMLASKVSSNARVLEGQLAELQNYVSAKATKVVRTVMRVPRTESAKPAEVPIKEEQGA
jgi:hypothetical protein